MKKLTSLAIFLFFCVASIASEAAVTANSIVTPQTPNRAIVQFLQGTDVAGTYKTLYTSGSNGSICYGMVTNNSDAGVTAGHLLNIQLVNSTVKYGGTALQTIPSAGFIAGTGGVGTSTPPQVITGSTVNAGVWSGLALDNLGNNIIQLVSGDTIQVTFSTAMTAGAVINLYATCNDF
jgi:hypothetical protein